jgi:hypothetical protein
MTGAAPDVREGALNRRNSTWPSTDPVQGRPQVVHWALKKMIQIERDPNAGDPLLGGLIGYRKTTVGDRDWRVVWRVVQDDAGDFRVEVAEVWAVGYRKDSEVYAEIEQRWLTPAPHPRPRRSRTSSTSSPSSHAI